MIVLTNPTGMISSPDSNADGMYDNNVDIMWMFKAEETKVIRYQLMYIQIQNSDLCLRDALVVCIIFILSLGKFVRAIYTCTPSNSTFI